MHEVRKALKRTRTVLRLCDGLWGAARRKRRADSCASGRTLSPFRDRHMLGEAAAPGAADRRQPLRRSPLGPVRAALAAEPLLQPVPEETLRTLLPVPAGRGCCWSLRCKAWTRPSCVRRCDAGCGGCCAGDDALCAGLPRAQRRPLSRVAQAGQRRLLYSLSVASQPTARWDPGSICWISSAKIWETSATSASWPMCCTNERWAGRRRRR